MAKTVVQLTETTIIETDDLLHVVDISANQDKKIKAANLWNGKPYGELYVSTSGDTTIAVTNTYYNLMTGGVIATSSGNLNKFSHANGKLTYNGTETILVDIKASVSFFSALNNYNANFAIYKNGSIITPSVQNGKADNTNPFNLALNCLTTMATDDYIEIYVKNEDSADELTVTYGYLSIVAL